MVKAKQHNLYAKSAKVLLWLYMLALFPLYALVYGSGFASFQSYYTHQWHFYAIYLSFGIPVGLFLLNWNAQQKKAPMWLAVGLYLLAFQSRAMLQVFPFHWGPYMNAITFVMALLMAFAPSGLALGLYGYKKLCRGAKLCRIFFILYAAAFAFLGYMVVALTRGID